MVLEGVLSPLMQIPVSLGVFGYGLLLSATAQSAPSGPSSRETKPSAGQAAGSMSPSFCCPAALEAFSFGITQ
ncbi:hypothetical protein FRC08_006920 [Ceratobasidium sp. 394]|nr:hypothetical protein FRC08_006920 [Ceratobasidium sp. 394]